MDFYELCVKAFLILSTFSSSIWPSSAFSFNHKISLFEPRVPMVDVGSKVVDLYQNVCGNAVVPL